MQNNLIVQNIVFQKALSLHITTKILTVKATKVIKLTSISPIITRKHEKWHLMIYNGLF